VNADKAKVKAAHEQVVDDRQQLAKDRAAHDKAAVAADKAKLAADKAALKSAFHQEQVDKKERREDRRELRKDRREDHEERVTDSHHRRTISAELARRAEGPPQEFDQAKRVVVDDPRRYAVPASGSRIMCLQESITARAAAPPQTWSGERSGSGMN
jgi:hypothetical protein